MKTVLIIESGATKTEWATAGKSGGLRFRTAGINCSVMSVESVVEIISCAAEHFDNIADEISEIRFYGAGLVSGENIIVLDKALKAVFHNAVTAYGSDLLAAARSVCGTSEGIVSILGTGSNSGFYDGKTIVRNVRSGGFILGDEGGGVALGKTLIANHIKGLLPEKLEILLSEKFDVSYETVVRNVYKGNNPAGYLASFVPFLIDNRGVDGVEEMIEANLRNFIGRVLLQYDINKYDVGVVGSFGYICRDELTRLGKEYGIRFSRFVKSPIDVLIKEYGE